jgi:hypothetical protein
MKRFAAIMVVGLTLGCSLCLLVLAQAALSSWAYFIEVTPETGAPGMHRFFVPLQVLDKSRDDLADLRLYDSQGKEIQYALRIRLDVDETREVNGRIFNNATVGANASEVSVDLGESPGEHNQVEIETSGTNFRRRVSVEGSDSGTNWNTLVSNALIFSFSAQNKIVQANLVSYPISRYRYLRLRVSSDELVDKAPPSISNVKAMMVIRDRGERVTWGLNVPNYELLRNQGGPGSSWTIDLGGHVPCDQLELDVNEAAFSRPFQLEEVDDPQSINLIASGDLTRRVGEEHKSLIIKFDHEVRARKLRLLVTDYSNQTLTINSIQASAPARELIFALKEPATQPLRLFVGNPRASAPHYDFENQLPSTMSPAMARVETGTIRNNPDYKPEPLPLTERVPWLIYLVLTASSIALALILISLARSTLRNHVEQPKGQTS